MEKMLSKWMKFVLLEETNNINSNTLSAPNGIDITDPKIYEPNNFESLKQTIKTNMTDEFKEFFKEYKPQQDENSKLNEIVSYFLRMSKELLQIKMQVLPKKHQSQQSMIAFNKVLLNYFGVKQQNQRNFILEEIKKFVQEEANKTKIILSILPEDRFGEFDPQYTDRIFVTIYDAITDYINSGATIYNSRISKTFSHEFSHMMDKKFRNFIIDTIKKNNIKSKNFKTLGGFSSYTFYPNLEDDMASLLNTSYKKFYNEDEDNTIIATTKEEKDAKNSVEYLIDSPELYVRMKQIQQLINGGKKLVTPQQVINLLKSGKIENYRDINNLIQILDLNNQRNIQKFTSILNTIAQNDEQTDVSLANRIA